MKINSKKFVIILTVLSIFLTTGFAQPFGQGMNRMGQGQGAGFQGMSPLIEPLFMGHGFAIAGEEYHILHVNVMKTKVLPADYFRSLLKENKTPEEIAKEITSMQRDNEIKGHLRFAGKSYVLNVTSYDNQSLSGEIMMFPQSNTKDFTPEIAGHISISTLNYETELLSSGTITMEGRDYNVLMTSPLNLRMGMGRWV